jgi:hypothetical protein
MEDKATQVGSVSQQMVSVHYTENSFVVIFPFKYFVGTDKAMCLSIHFVLSKLLVACLLLQQTLVSLGMQRMLSISKMLSNSIALELNKKPGFNLS